MALKKGFCTHCSSKNKKNHIIMVNPEAEHVFCPHCMAKLDPKIAIQDYEVYISELILEAQRTLYQKTDFYNAYCQFADIVDIEPESDAARYGRIISLIYMSTLRKSKYKETTVLLETEATAHFHKSKDLAYYAKFLKKCNRAIDEYLSNLPKRLSCKAGFYDLECIKLYLTRLDEIINLKKVLLKELEFVIAKEDNDKIKESYNELEKSISEIEKTLNNKHLCVDGYRYALAKKSSRGEMILGRSDVRKKQVNRFIKYTLDDKNTNGRLIKDKMYPDNIHIAKSVKKTIPLTILFLLIGGGLLTPFFFIKEIYKYAFLGGASLFFLLALITLILHIKWKRQLAKRRHLID